MNDDRQADRQDERQLDIQPVEQSPGHQRDERRETESEDDRQRLGGAFGFLIFVGDRVGPSRALMRRADLLEPASGVGPKGAAERDQEALNHHHQKADRQNPDEV